MKPKPSMAISITKQPSKYSPSGNPLFLSVESSNGNIVYFNVTVKSGAAIVSTLKLYPSPATPLVGSIDLSNILSNYTSTPISNTSALTTSFSTGYLNYSIEIEEMIIDNYLGGTDGNGQIIPNPNYGAITVGGQLTISDLNVFNAELSSTEFSFYGYRNFYVNPITKAKFLTTKPSINKINPWSKEFLYFLADGDSTISQVVIKTYLADGTVNTYDEIIGVTTSKLHRLNVSPKHLKTTLSIDFDTVKKFEVYLIDGSGNTLTNVQTYTCINLPCNYEPVNILWKNKYGGLDSFTFINPKEVKSINRSTFQTNKYINYSISNAGVINPLERTYNVSSVSDYTLNSPVLNDWEFVFLTDMLASEQVYVELNDGSLYPIKLKTTQAEVKRKKYQTTLPRLQITYEGESNLNLVPDSYLTFASGLSQIGFNVPTLLSMPSGYYETLIGDGTSLYYSVNHNLQSVNIAIDLVYVSNGQTVFGDVVRLDNNNVSIEFGEAIATDSVKVMISKLD